MDLDSLKLIFNKLDFLSQIRFRQISRFYYKNLQITDLFNIDYKYIKLLNDKILKKYPYVEFSNASRINRIKNINHMKNLKKLFCIGDCGIDNKNMKNLNLIELNVNYNSKIKNIGHMKNLKVLICEGNCGIKNKDIKELNLIELDVSHNAKIKNINHMKNLRILFCEGDCGIGDE